jgi:hypothetical protein
VDALLGAAAPRGQGMRDTNPRFLGDLPTPDDSLSTPLAGGALEPEIARLGGPRGVRCPAGNRARGRLRAAVNADWRGFPFRDAFGQGTGLVRSAALGQIVAFGPEGSGFARRAGGSERKRARNFPEDFARGRRRGSRGALGFREPWLGRFRPRLGDGTSRCRFPFGWSLGRRREGGGNAQGLTWAKHAIPREPVSSAKLGDAYPMACGNAAQGVPGSDPVGDLTGSGAKGSSAEGERERDSEAE